MRMWLVFEVINYQLPSSYFLVRNDDFTDQICYIKLYCVFKNKADTNVDEIDFFVVDPYTRK